MQASVSPKHVHWNRKCRAVPPAWGAGLALAWGVGCIQQSGCWHCLTAGSRCWPHWHGWLVPVVEGSLGGLVLQTPENWLEISPLPALPGVSGHHCSIYVRRAEEQVVFMLYCSTVYCYILVDVQPLHLWVPLQTTAAVDPVNMGFVSLHGMTGVVSFPQFTSTLKLDSVWPFFLHSYSDCWD